MFFNYNFNENQTETIYNEIRKIIYKRHIIDILIGENMELDDYDKKFIDKLIEALTIEILNNKEIKRNLTEQNRLKQTELYETIYKTFNEYHMKNLIEKLTDKKGNKTEILKETSILLTRSIADEERQKNDWK